MIRRHRDLLLGVFTVSLSSLAYEVLLSRYFSVAQWNHLTFMVLSIAMFGTGAAGVLTGLLPIDRGRVPIIVIAVTAFACFALGGYFAVNALPLEIFRIPIQPVQSLFLAVAFILFGLPFLAAGTVSSYGYAACPELAGKLYLWSMLGSAAGAAVPWILIPLVGIGPAIVAVSVFPALALPWLPMKRKYLGRLGAPLLIAAAALALLLGLPGVNVNVSSYKGLPQLMSVPGSTVVSSSSTMRGEVTLVRSASVRYDPGASLKSRAPIPEQDGLFVDGHTYGAVPATGAETDLAYARETLDFTPYAVRPKPGAILIIQEGGGHAVTAALATGGNSPILVISQPSVARIARSRYARFGVAVVETTPRAFIARGGQRFDIIHIDDPGGSLPGLEALNQNHIFTVEAFRGYLDRCSPGGLIALSRGLQLPPSDLPKMAATIAQALVEAGVGNPSSHIAITRSFDRYCVLVSPTPLSADLISSLRSFTLSSNFDLVHYPGMSIEEANRFNVLPEPYYAHAAEELLSTAGREYIEESIVDIRPNTDARPYLTKFVKWSRLRELVTMTGGRGYAYLLSGEVLVWVVFGAALVFVTAGMILPVSAVALIRRAKSLERASNRAGPRTIPLFILLGAGYMLLELGLIDTMILVTGSPSVSFALVLPVMLVSSGIGGYMGERLREEIVPKITVAIFCAGIMLAAGAARLEGTLLAASPAVRYIGIAGLIAVVAFPMGIPFPAAMRATFGERGRSAAWAANGSASVLASILAVPIAMNCGIPWLFGAAAIMYLGVYAAERTRRKSGKREDRKDDSHEGTPRDTKRNGEGGRG